MVLGNFKYFQKRSKKLVIFFWVLSIIFVFASNLAESIELSIPIDCRVGVNCWIVNYVDHDPTKDSKDFRCGNLSYDGHKGTDFAIRNLRSMELGVEVRAAASGKVVAVRDGMLDIGLGTNFLSNIKGRECGNGVRVGHPGGWSTQYCHLKKDSIAVFTGQKISMGDKIGFVGLSGKTEFPHVHFSVRFRGKIIDPFVGVTSSPNCKKDEKPLWARDARTFLKYEPPYIYSAGFAPVSPKVQAIRSGEYDGNVLSKNSPAIVFWVDTFAINAGYEISMTLTGADGKQISSRRKTIKKYQARYLLFIGKKRGVIDWPVGTYIGETIIRNVSSSTPRHVKRVRKKLYIR